MCKYDIDTKLQKKETNLTRDSDTDTSDLGYYNEETIPVDRIVNRTDVFRKIRFASPDEASDPDILLNITKDFGKWKKYVIWVLDATPDIAETSKKKYVLVYGHKRLYAAVKLGFDRIKVRVFTKTAEKAMDKKIITRFFGADYASMTPYEKGEFLETVMKEENIGFEELAPGTGLPYATLRAFNSAYKAAMSVSPHLYRAYKADRLATNLVNLGKKYYLCGSDEYRKRLTDFFCEHGETGYKALHCAVESSDDDMPIRETIVKAMELYERKKAEVTAGRKNKKTASAAYPLIDSAFGLHTARVHELAELVKETGLPKGRKKQLYFLAAGGLISDDQCTPVLFDGLDPKIITTIDYLTGLLESSKRNYDSLENALKKDEPYWNAAGFQREFSKAAEFPYKISYISRLPEEFIPFADKIRESGTKESFDRFHKYIKFSTDKAFSPEHVVALYSDDYIRGFFGDFCKYAIRYRDTRKAVADYFNGFRSREAAIKKEERA